MDNNEQPAAPSSKPVPAPVSEPTNNTTESVTFVPQESPVVDEKKPINRKLVIFLRTLVIGGGLFSVLVVGLGISFSACFTIKGPPPPECAPVSFVSLVLLPAGSLFFLIPLAKRIK